MMHSERGDPRRRPWILRGVGIACAVALNTVLVLFGCGVDHLPGLPNETPNPSYHFDDPAGPDATGAGGAGASSACECAAALYSGSNATCGSCAKGIVSPGQPCQTYWKTCTADPACLQIITCLGTKCSGADGGAIQACLDSCLLPLNLDSAHQHIADVLTCTCSYCGTCTYAGAVSCSAGPGADGGSGG